jgi:hypothetical protein
MDAESVNTGTKPASDGALKSPPSFQKATSRTAFEKKRQGSAHSFFDLALLL